MQTPAHSLQAALVPPATDLDALRALYTRVHWLVTADMDRALAEGEAAVGEGGSPGLVKILSRTLAALRELSDSYQSDYAHYIGQADEGSLETMRRFIRSARALHGKKPEFAFLFVRPEPARADGDSP